MQYNSMKPQNIVEHEEKRRVNALLLREKQIRGLGITELLAQLLPTAETQRPCVLQSQVTALPTATPHRSGSVQAWALSISAGAGWGLLQAHQLLCLQDDESGMVLVT